MEKVLKRIETNTKCANTLSIMLGRELAEKDFKAARFSARLIISTMNDLLGELINICDGDESND